jgi:hypothetical protein
VELSQIRGEAYFALAMDYGNDDDADCGPSQGGRRRRASRPLAAFLG